MRNLFIQFLRFVFWKEKEEQYLHSVGFEPTNLSISDLESDALDHSAMNATPIFSFLTKMSIEER